MRVSEDEARYILHKAAEEKLKRAHHNRELLRQIEEAERSIEAGEAAVPLEEVEREIREARARDLRDRAPRAGSHVLPTVGRA